MGWRDAGGGRIAAAMVLLAGLGGCAADGGISPPSPVGEVPIARAFMMPPPGGPAIISVIERRYINAVAQDIILDNNTALPQPNALYVRAFGPMGRDAGEGTLAQDVPSLAGIQRELRQRFPGVGMQISSLYAQNRYGALGYATGRSRGNNCVYVWQRIAAEPSLFRFEVGAVSWRLRLCDPDTSLRDLLLVAYGVTVTGSFKSRRWNPFGDPPSPDPRIGQPGVAILPETMVDPTVIAPRSFGAEPRRTAPRRQVSAVRRPKAPTPAALNRPAPGAVVVPRPQNTNLSEPTVRGSSLPNVPTGSSLAAPRPATTAPATDPPSSAPTLAPPPPGPAIAGPDDAPAKPPQVRVIAPD